MEQSMSMVQEPFDQWFFVFDLISQSLSIYLYHLYNQHVIFVLPYSRNKDGTIYEHGPRTIRPVGPQGANTLQMIEELGLVDRYFCNVIYLLSFQFQDFILFLSNQNENNNI